METDMHTSSGEVRMRSTLLTPSGKRNLKNFGSDADKVIVRFSSILIKKIECQNNKINTDCKLKMGCV